MDIFGKKRIEELEAEVRDLKEREASLEARYQRRKKNLDEREKAIDWRGLWRSRELDRLQKRLRRIRNAARKVRAGAAPVEKLLREVLNGKVR